MPSTGQGLQLKSSSSEAGYDSSDDIPFVASLSEGRRGPMDVYMLCIGLSPRVKVERQPRSYWALENSFILKMVTQPTPSNDPPGLRPSLSSWRGGNATFIKKRRKGKKMVSCRREQEKKQKNLRVVQPFWCLVSGTTKRSESNTQPLPPPPDKKKHISPFLPAQKFPIEGRNRRKSPTRQFSNFVCLFSGRTRSFRRSLERSEA